MGEDYMDVLADGAWEKIFKVKPAVFTAEEKRAWLDKIPMWHWDRMHSSHLATILSAHTKAA